MIKRYNKVFVTGAACLLASAGCSGMDSSGEQVQTLKAPIINGAVVANDGTMPGILAVKLTDSERPIERCSAVLLTNDWLITATHCLPTSVQLTTNPAEYDPVASGFEARAFQGDEVRTGAQVARIARHPAIFGHWHAAQGADVAMVKFNTPFTVQGSTTSLTNSPTVIRGSDVHSLVGQTVTAQGYGNSVCQAGAGTLRTADIIVSSIDSTSADVTANNSRTFNFVPKPGTGEMPTNGDSGGGLFFGSGSDMTLIGITGGGTTECDRSTYTTFDAFRDFAYTTILGGWGQNLGWCQQASQNLLVADVQGDGRDDMICHDTSTGILYVSHARYKPDGTVPVQGFTGSGPTPEPGLFGGTSWSSSASQDFCRANVGTLYMGDFNADLRADALCHGFSGQNWIVRGTSNGEFDLSNVWTDAAPASFFCPSSLGTLSVADFSGDGRSDILCHDGATGHNWIAYGSAAGYLDFGPGAIWTDTTTDYCRDTTGKIYLGKFNDDSKADLMCHNHTTGHTWIVYTGEDYRPKWSTLWSSSYDFCSGSDQQMRVGDFDGSGRDDLICHSMSTSATWMALTDALDHPEFGSAGQGLGWCAQPNDQLLTGSFSMDYRKDLLCHNRADSGSPLQGRQSVIFTGPGGTYPFE